MSIDAHILKPLDFFTDFSTQELEECADKLFKVKIKKGISQVIS